VLALDGGGLEVNLRKALVFLGLVVT
jgi:hypothetical protein